jgi:hypothetical protein
MKNKTTKKFILICLCLTMCLVSKAHAEESFSQKAQFLSEIFFPDSKSWTTAKDIPVCDKKNLKSDLWELRSIYLNTKQYDLMESPDCSFITRALYEHFDPALFKCADFDGDGFKDVIYTGPGECREGDITIVWFRKECGFAKRDVKIYPYSLLKAELKNGRGFTWVEIGCCAALVDNYYLWYLDNKHKRKHIKVVKHLQIPKGVEIKSSQYVSQNELVLRSSPKVDDAYDKSSSERADAAVFGNIVIKLLSGAKGMIAARYKDGNHVEWGLLIVDEESKALVHHDPFNTNVGWIIIEK